MYPKTFFSSNLFRERSGTCFVIMPFKAEFQQVYRTIVAAVTSEELGFECQRADDIVGGGHILDDVLRRIAESEIIIADLTGSNPNVFLELGIVQMTKSVEKVILLNQTQNSVPFDVQDLRCVFYEQTDEGLERLRLDIVSAIRAGAKKLFRFKVSQGSEFKFPQRVMGADNCAYDFEINADYLAIDGSKFLIRVNRYAAGQPPAVCYADGWGLSVGRGRQLPNLNWDLELESVAANVATFVFKPHAE